MGDTSDTGGCGNSKHVGAAGHKCGVLLLLRVQWQGGRRSYRSSRYHGRGVPASTKRMGQGRQDRPIPSRGWLAALLQLSVDVLPLPPPHTTPVRTSDADLLCPLAHPECSSKNNRYTGKNKRGGGAVCGLWRGAVKGGGWGVRKADVELIAPAFTAAAE